LFYANFAVVWLSRQTTNIEDKLTRLIEDMKYIDKKMPYA